MSFIKLLNSLIFFYKKNTFILTAKGAGGDRSHRSGWWLTWASIIPHHPYALKKHFPIRQTFQLPSPCSFFYTVIQKLNPFNDCNNFVVRELILIILAKEICNIAV